VERRAVRWGLGARRVELGPEAYRPVPHRQPWPGGRIQEGGQAIGPHDDRRALRPVGGADGGERLAAAGVQDGEDRAVVRGRSPSTSHAARQIPDGLEISSTNIASDHGVGNARRSMAMTCGRSA
jgi:hypothetical protein